MAPGEIRIAEKAVERGARFGESEGLALAAIAAQACGQRGVDVERSLDQKALLAQQAHQSRHACHRQHSAALVVGDHQLLDAVLPVHERQQVELARVEPCVRASGRVVHDDVLGPRTGAVARRFETRGDTRPLFDR